MHQGKKKKTRFESLAVFTGDLHAGVDGSGGFDGGRGVSAVHLVRLGVLSFAVDHRYAQTQALSERLSSASTKSNTHTHTRAQSNARRRMWDVKKPTRAKLRASSSEVAYRKERRSSVRATQRWFRTFWQKQEIWPQSLRSCSRGSEKVTGRH